MTLETAAAANASDGTSASGSSFYAAMRILPREQREAMFQIYSFCRQVDDIADSNGPRAVRLAELGIWRDDIDALYAGNPPARVKDYVPSVKQFGLRRDDYIAIIDGMEMDVPADIRAPDARRSISTATVSPARSDGCRCGCSVLPRPTASCSRIISGVRCS